MALSLLIVGAGRSSSSLINYLKAWGVKSGVSILVGDVAFSGSGPDQIHFDILDVDRSREAIRSVDLVISMIPAYLHPAIARLCLHERKHLMTASYVSEEMKSFDKEAKDNGLLFLNECGLDPGIDHMSAMKIMDHIRDSGGTLTSFESFTGGLIAQETDPDNAWRYKFTWNPRNVVMAGQGVSRFLEDGQYKFVPYQQLFTRITNVSIPGSGDYEGYANRDSLGYREAYGLQDVRTMQRGTLRCKGYCAAWNIVVQLGCTDDTYAIPDVEGMTHQDFIRLFLERSNDSVEMQLIKKFNLQNDGPEITRLRWSGLFNKEAIGLSKGTPAQVLEHILNKKWKLNPEDKDLVVMWHRFVYKSDDKEKELQSSLVVTGEDSVNTAMAKTVGLPLGIAARLLMEGKIKARGVVIPTLKEIYEPILLELGKRGIVFHEY